MAIHDELFLRLGPGRPQISFFGLEEKRFGTPVLEEKNKDSETIFTEVSSP